MDVFGTMADVEELIKAVHDRKMRIIFDLVLNHTSECAFYERIELSRKEKLYLLVLANIPGSSNRVRLVRTPNVTGTSGETANPVVFAQITGSRFSTAPLGSTTKKPTSTTCICFLVKCPI